METGLMLKFYKIGFYMLIYFIQLLISWLMPCIQVLNLEF